MHDFFFFSPSETNELERDNCFTTDLGEAIIHRHKPPPKMKELLMRSNLTKEKPEVYFIKQ